MDYGAMARATMQGKATLDARFKFADTAFSSGTEGWNSQLRFATGIADGEDYLLRLFKKTGTPLDEDLKRLITHGLRRVRRVLSSRRARQLLVEVLEIVEDQEEIGILMVDPGSPICGSLHRVRAREGRLLTTTGRKMFWRNILRVAEGLALCHDAGIVHGAVSEHTIFSHSATPRDAGAVDRNFNVNRYCCPALASTICSTYTGDPVPSRRRLPSLPLASPNDAALTASALRQ